MQAISCTCTGSQNACDARVYALQLCYCHQYYHHYRVASAWSVAGVILPACFTIQLKVAA